MSANEESDELEYTHPLDEYIDEPYNSADVADKQKKLDALLMSSDGEDPPMGIIDNGSSGVFWRGPLAAEKEANAHAAQLGRGNASLGAHDGEKHVVAAHNQPNSLKSALTAASTATGARPLPKTKQPVPLVSHSDDPIKLELIDVSPSAVIFAVT